MLVFFFENLQSKIKNLSFPSINFQQWMGYINLIFYALYIASWHLFQCGKHLHRLIYGTSQIPLKQVRLHRIIYRRKRDYEEISRREDFITLDDGYDEKQILKSPEWVIYSLDKKGAIFVQLPMPLSHYSIDKYPFVYTPCFDEAIRVAEIDLESYISLGDQLELDYKPPRCLFFTNTARCGSTLFGSMLHHEGYSNVIAEPYALTGLSIGLKEGYWNDNDIDRLLPVTIRLLRKGIPSNHFFVIKTTCSEVNLVPFLSQQFPEMKHIFMFRRRGLLSVEKVLSRDPSILILIHLYNILPYLATSIFGFLVATEGSLQRQFKSTHIKEVSMLVYGGPYMTYKENKDIFDFPIVWHDELIASPEKVLSSIFDELDIPETCIQTAVARMQNDSQAGTYLSRENLQDIYPSKMTPELKYTLQRYAEKLQIEPDVHGIEA